MRNCWKNIREIRKTGLVSVMSFECYYKCVKGSHPRYGISISIDFFLTFYWLQVQFQMISFIIDIKTLKNGIRNTTKKEESTPSINPA